MNKALAFIVCLILVGIGIGSFSGFVEGIGWSGLEYDRFLPTGLEMVFWVLTVSSGIFWYHKEVRR